MKRPAHIIEIITDPNSVTYFNHFAELSKNHPEIKLSFICLNDVLPPMVQDMKQRNCDVYWIPFNTSQRKRSWLKAYYPLKRLLKRLKPDVVHSHLFDDGFITMHAAKKLGIEKRIHTKQCTAYHWYHAPKAVLLDRMINKWATHLISVSTESKNFLIEKERADPAKIKLIHHGIHLNTFSQTNPNAIKNFKDKFSLHNKRVIATLARYVEWKGYQTFIEAAAIIAERYPDVVFLGIGSGPLEHELRQLIKEKNLEHRFILTGWLDKSIIPFVFQSIDIYVHCAFMEPFGFVIPEAMASRVPVVSTRTGSAGDAIIHLESGYLTDYHSPQQTATGIEHMLNNNTSPITEKAYRTIETDFTIETMWQRHLDLYLAKSSS